MDGTEGTDGAEGMDSTDVTNDVNGGEEKIRGLVTYVPVM